ncbi:MAG TPA: MFS transporter [Candidatus Hydrogenedentes bacterium]|nr:MFS transporter [Candidatus Hydrogenedentota bacterium]HQH52850.1 MFS transporter [Candidatus Hydrogenedentota bacterium]HQM50702.1 MFS transporter [Candidatus Hydrogenedentota bacterium]
MKRWFWLLAATTPVAFIASVTWYGAFTFANAYMIRGLGASNAQWTRATLAMSGGMMFWYVLTMELSAVFGRRRTATLGAAIASFAYVSLPLAHDVGVVSVLLALMGFGTAGYLVAWLPYVTHVGGERPARALTGASIVYNLVSAIMIFALGPALQEARFRLTFFSTGGLCLACVVAFHFAARHLEKRVAASGCGEDKEEHAEAPLSLLKLQWHNVRELMYSAFPMVLLLGICSAPFAFHTSNQLFPNLARDVYHFREDSIARLVALARLPAMLMMFLVSPVIDRLNLVRFYGISLFADGLLIAAIALSHSAWVASGAYLLFYTSHGLVWAFALPAINVCVRPRLRDSAFTLTAVFEIVGVFFAGLLHNRLIEMGGSLALVFIVCGTIVCLSGVLLLGYSYSAHARGNGSRNGP